MRELLCCVVGFRIPFVLAVPPIQKLPSSDAHNRGLPKLRLTWPSKEPTGCWFVALVRS